jgi:hypothetical protein
VVYFLFVVWQVRAANRLNTHMESLHGKVDTLLSRS